MRIFLFAAALLIAAGAADRPSAPPPVSLAIVNARVWTGEPAPTMGGGGRVSGDRIAAVGSSAEIREARRQQHARDRRRGRDGRARLHRLRTSISSAAASGSRPCSCATAKTPREFVGAHQGVRAHDAAGRVDHAAATGTTRSGAASCPNESWIDSVTPNNPVWVNRLDGHMALANSLALAAAKVTQATRRISPAAASCAMRSGEPTGVLKDNAQWLVDAAMPRSAAGARRPRARCER